MDLEPDPLAPVADGGHAPSTGHRIKKIQPSWEAGPLVRLYAMTSGRARPVGGEPLDLMIVVHGRPHPGPVTPLSPEERRIHRLCVPRPRPVADIASDAGLPLVVVRVLLGNLLEAGLVRVSPPVPAAQLPDPGILRRVIDGLRAL
ncbi:DUF742 domain-containing protein [Streptomyces sp. NPDC059957]|uniref:DUF742 domain-containing protein n=1 Tax=unclassified Streptomyces TaxID=2593676 RepID=UPI003656A04E